MPFSNDDNNDYDEDDNGDDVHLHSVVQSNVAVIVAPSVDARAELFAIGIIMILMISMLSMISMIWMMLMILTENASTQNTQNELQSWIIIQHMWTQIGNTY